MGVNYTGRSVRRKHDEWYFFDQLPQILRSRLACSTLPWSASSILDRYRKYKAKKGRIAALSLMLDEFDRWDLLQAVQTPWDRKTKEPPPCAIAKVGPLITNYHNMT